MMTTPEAFRRRQRIELTVLAVLAAGFLVFGILDGRDEAENERRDDAQTACIAENFTELNYALAFRGKLAGQDDLLDRREARVSNLERRATRRVLSFVATVTIDPPADLVSAQEQFLRVLTAYDRQLDKVRERRTAIVERRALIADKRERHPVPPYPEGECR